MLSGRDFTGEFSGGGYFSGEWQSHPILFEAVPVCRHSGAGAFVACVREQADALFCIAGVREYPKGKADTCGICSVEWLCLRLFLRAGAQRLWGKGAFAVSRGAVSAISFLCAGVSRAGGAVGAPWGGETLPISARDFTSLCRTCNWNITGILHKSDNFTKNIKIFLKNYFTAFALFVIFCYSKSIFLARLYGNPGEFRGGFLHE